MNKQELIDKAVHDLSGKWPKREECKSITSCYAHTTYEGVVTEIFINNIGCITKEEFEQRAKELGYGVEPSSWYDYTAQKAVALPPVGTECEINSLIGWVKCEILAHGNCKDNGKTAFWQAEHDCGAYYSACKFRPLDWNKQAEQERKRVVDAAMEMAVDAHTLENILASLYDAGFLKIPDDKNG
jgi:hypothetical protein